MLASSIPARGPEGLKKGSQALFYWISGFVIPYIASTLVDYAFIANNPDSGMPGGRLWYVPKFETNPGSPKPDRLIMPSQQVLFWWEDLLGRRLEHFDKQLCGQASDPDSARRQISSWKNEARPPDSETIRRWTNQTWQYEGTFRDDPGCSLGERWGKCRDFLAGKGMLGDSDWIKSAANSAFDPDRSLVESYRGERLEQEIPPFQDCCFKRFFESSDPVAERLPVEALIQRVATRWRIPTRVELHSRLMVGRALNVAWNACLQSLGPKGVFDLMLWGTRCYNHFMTICGKSTILSPQESMRIHCQIVDQADSAFYPIAAMLDEGYWIGLPAYLRMWIRNEVVFKN